MTELDKARELIAQTDREMAKLFEKRMEAVRRVAEYKKEHALPVADKQREELVLRENAGYINDEDLRSYYVGFLKSEIEISKQYQRRVLDGMRVAYAGVEGAFANIAAEKIFPEAVCAPYTDFAAAYKAVEDGECDCAVLPVENSTNGDVGTVLDLAFFGSLYINGMYEIEIVQNLLALPGVAPADVKEALSHPQALGQCTAYLKQHGITPTESVNTAVAAKYVAESGRKDIAAIGSAEAGEKYGLSVIAPHINESGFNTTRFAVFSRAKRETGKNDARFVMLFTVNNTAGSLAKAINVIGDHGFNLRAIKSRPRKELIWDYYFYAEGEGNIATEKGADMLDGLYECCKDLRIVGTYEKDVRI